MSKSAPERCQHDDSPTRPLPDLAPCQRAAGMFRALGDTPRLQILCLLLPGELCVSDIAHQLADNLPAVSQRLKLLRRQRIVVARRSGKHVFYALADSHIAQLVSNALAHAAEIDDCRQLSSPRPSEKGPTIMSTHTHGNHPHEHGPDCGHVGVQHAGHTDYLHDGHLHHMRADGQVEEHQLDVTAGNPAACTPNHACSGHAAEHVHGPDCGHPAVPHGDHVDYLVEGHLHHPHGDHCDDHGKVQTV